MRKMIDHKAPISLNDDVAICEVKEASAFGAGDHQEKVDAYVFLGSTDPKFWETSEWYNSTIAELYKRYADKKPSKTGKSVADELVSFEQDGVLYMIYRSGLDELLKERKSIFAEQRMLAKISQMIKDVSAKTVCVDATRLHCNEDHMDFPLLWQLMYALQVNFYKLPHYRKHAEEGSLIGPSFHVLPPAKESFKNFSFASGNHMFSGFSRASNFVRHMMVEPANRLTPRSFVECVRKESERLGLDFRFYGYDELEEMGAGAFCAVAGAHPDSGAGIVKVSYDANSHASGSSAGGSNCGDMRIKDIAFVGKGITFDSGGVNVKPAAYMRGMKNDMTGASLAFAMLQLACEQKWPVKVTSYLAVADNLISSSAFKPDDVVKSLSGITIEIVHTDAEGRMILADTLALASEEQPDLIIDFATLTGSSVRAISRRYSSAFTNRSAWYGALIDAGRNMGERVWPFPLDDDFAECLKSDVADTMQCRPSVGVDHIEAAMFLQKFVGKGIPWLHLDLSSARTDAPMGAYLTKETGFGPRFVSDFIGRLQRSKAEDFSDL